MCTVDLLLCGAAEYRLCIRWCFFFQAEDGIRYLVRSRGLGDVYKRQLFVLGFSLIFLALGATATVLGRVMFSQRDMITKAVSYTHLTLPTSDLV
mgnify:CR=1 FL=1